MLSVRSIALAGLCFFSFMSSSCFAFTVQNSAVARRSSQSNFIPQEQKFARTKTQIYYGDNNEEERKVAVFEIPNVDAATLTAIGFAAIAFNFLVLANLGDGGIGGVVATFINNWDDITGN